MLEFGEAVEIALSDMAQVMYGSRLGRHQARIAKNLEFSVAQVKNAYQARVPNARKDVIAALEAALAKRTKAGEPAPSPAPAATKTVAPAPAPAPAPKADPIQRAGHGQDLSQLDFRTMGFRRDPAPKPAKVEESFRVRQGVVEEDRIVTGQAFSTVTPRPTNERNERVRAPEQRREDRGMADGEKITVQQERVARRPKSPDEEPFRVQMGVQGKPAVRERGETFRANTAPRDEGGPVRGR
jgi:hypothetical protein